MDPFLARAEAALRSTVEPLSDAELRATLPGKWSTAEIVEHLERAYAVTARAFERAAAAPHAAEKRPTLANRIGTFVVVTCGYLPSGRQAPENTLPSGADPAAALTAALDAIQRMNEAVERLAGRFGARAARVEHPVLGALSVRQWCKFHLVHTRHHLRQIEATVRAHRAG